MRHPSFTLIALFFSHVALFAQAQKTARYEIEGGFSYLSNSFNGVPGSRQPLNGWDASLAFPAWHNLRFKMDVSGYDGSNLGARQRALFIMAGGQYERSLRRERLFAQALFGEAGLNPYWGANRARGDTASFATLLGGGVDTPLSRHIGIRVEGDFLSTNFALHESATNPNAREIPGQPDYFGRISTGLVWIPRLVRLEDRTDDSPKEPVESEVAFESLNSFGHYHVLAASWWSYLNVGGVEYDRHSWGRFIGAQMDYVAEILPVVILRQPSKTDAFGDRFSTTFLTNPGLGISPVGLRMLWRDGKAWKPYFTVKGGLMAFTNKALSSDASYLNFSFQQSVGVQFRLHDRWDFRAGVADFHFSDGFMVPSNPGIDEMAYTGALCYHLGKRRAGY